MVAGFVVAIYGKKLEVEIIMARAKGVRGYFDTKVQGNGLSYYLSNNS
jgi:hypothetical protein